MAKDVPSAEAPRSLKRLLDPLTGLLGVPVAVNTNPGAPVWPDPGAEAHAILHREYPERGPCPWLDPGSSLADADVTKLTCPLGLSVERFPLVLRDGRPGELVVGPYFTNPADRQALFGRSRAADAALHVLPCLLPQRRGLIEHFYREFAAFAGSAARAGAAKEQFLANMSHELRTPLNGIMGMLSLLLQSEDDGRRRQFLELAMNASNQLLGVINALLDLNGIASGRLVLAEELFEPRRMLAELFAMCAEDAASRGLAFQAVVADDVPDQLVGDPQRLRQVLLNLIHNGLKYTERGGLDVAVTMAPTQNARSDAAKLLFSVRDTGIGIAPDRQEAIFDHFAIGEPFLGKRYAQAGLGLGIARDIVEKMGGRLRVESELGQGSTFTFTAELRRPCVECPTPTTNETAQPIGGGAVIVHAEDDPVAQLLVRRILEDRGYVPIAVDSCEGLFDILGSRPVDMVLMDVAMPGLCGLESTRRIRRGESGAAADIPIVGLSGSATSEDRRQGLLAGMTDYIAKPVTRFELLAVVQRALAGRPFRAA
jgi:signal transduction histidine kinase/ActR/RegA family two-component response regulator